jgi:putative addiction module component (TIGR02574 family)
MASQPADLLSDALALPARERAKIAHELLLSLDEGADDDAAEAWVAELEHRAAEVRSGAATTEDWASVKARLTDRWHRR